jgi:nitroreductase
MAKSETIDVIARRYSCRAFSGKPVPGDVVDAILTAGLHAPSAVNRQPWRLIVIRDKALIDQMNDAGVSVMADVDPDAYERTKGRGGLMLYNAPLMIIIAEQMADNTYADLDCGIMASHLALAAASLGVDSCIAGMPRILFSGDDGAALVKRIGMPDGFRFALSLLLGYAAGEHRPGHDIDPTKVIEAG